MKFLVLGGAGYIGSHFVKYAQREGHACAVVDNLSRGHRKFVPKGTKFFETDIRNRDAMIRILADVKPDAVLHYAALALVGESVTHPHLYYDTNVGGTLAVVDAMRQSAPETPLVFSSTCAIFGSPQSVPVSESAPFAPESPYGRTKLACETLLQDAVQAYGMRVMALRYFNACGADPEGTIGEDHEPETHLIPNVLMSIYRKKTFELYGDDYPTADGSCIRDYIHVTDLADAHVRAAQLLTRSAPRTFLAANLGTGRGHSNREVIAACEKITGRSVTIQIKPRRSGDATALYADPSQAQALLGFQPHHSTLDTIIQTAWRWHSSQLRPEI